MTFKHAVGAVAFTLLATAGAASAQTTNFVTVSTAPTTSATPGASGATFGTITLTAPQTGEFGSISLASVPVTLSAGNGGSVSNLSACQVFSPTGTAITTGSNSVATAGASNTFTFDTPLQISGGQSTALSIRCNVASGSPSGATYQFSAGMPVYTAGLAVNLNASPTVRPGAQDSLVALITLSGARSGSAVQVSSIPLSATFSNGAGVGHISDCRVRNLSNLVSPLNNGGNAIGIVQGSNTIPLDTPLQIAAGSTQTLAFTCDVSSAAPVGGSVGLALTPSTLGTTIVGSGTTITPTAGFGTNNQMGATSGSVVFSASAPVDPTPTIPGVPNTGSDAMQTMLLLAIAGVVAIAGIFLARKLTITQK